MKGHAPSLKARALRLQAGREHSRQELERKLARHETVPGELQAALDALQAKGFINEERAAENLVHRRAGKLGAARVRAELQSLGLDAAVVDEAVESLQASEFERAQAVWRKKFGQPPADAAERARQLRFLASRGFAPGVLRRVVAGEQDGDGFPPAAGDED